MFLPLKPGFLNRLLELLEEPQGQHSLNIRLDVTTWPVSIHKFFLKKTQSQEHSIFLKLINENVCDKFLSDVSAKDGSQETAIGLLGMLLAIVVTPLVGDSQFLTWVCFWFFTTFHLYANYKAVTSVVMERLNRQRADIVIDAFLASNQSLDLFSVFLSF
jgi:hypothetical protein